MSASGLSRPRRGQWLAPAKRAFWRATELLGARVLRIRLGPAAGARIVAPLRLWPSYRRGLYEPQVARTMGELLGPGMVALDVGGFLGYHSLVMAKLVAPGGRVHVFEPVPEHAACLRRTAELNPGLWISVVEAAAGESEGVARLAEQPNPAMTYLRAAASSLPGREVRVVSLDRWSEQQDGLRRLELIKVDVEGHELAVLRGARRLLRRFRPHILCEIHHQRHIPYAPDELVAWLVAEEYDVAPLRSEGRPELDLRESLRRLADAPLAAGRVGALHLLARPAAGDARPVRT